jgi:GT2 family glycosyltransferase
LEKVAIVVLNYLNYNDTIECVKSITVDLYPAKKIIIVDNGSTNDSREKLEKKYRNCNGIHLVLSEQNEGFSRGNNLGIRYATESLGCKFVLLINNDTLFEDPLMITTLMKAYEPGVGVLGPRIVTADGDDQNPMSYVKFRSKWKQYWHYSRIIMRGQYKRTTFYQTIRKLNILKKWRKPKIRPNNLALNSCTSIKLKLQGSCFMLTPDFFKYYPYLFPETFLYFEEEILTILTYKVDLAKKFVHITHIYHKEHMSTKMSFDYAKRIRTGYRLHSLKMARKVYPLDYDAVINKYFSKAR